MFKGWTCENSQRLPIALRMGSDLVRPQLSWRGFGRFLLAVVPTTLFLMLILGPAMEVYCACWPGQEKILRYQNWDSNESFAEGLMIQPGIMWSAGDTGWTDWTIYIGKRQYMSRMTGWWWLLFGVCIGLVILVFLWKPIERRYRRYRRKYRRRKQKESSRI
jgi:hypothetical protein